MFAEKVQADRGKGALSCGRTWRKWEVQEGQEMEQ